MEILQYNRIFKTIFISCFIFLPVISFANNFPVDAITVSSSVLLPVPTAGGSKPLFSLIISSTTVPSYTILDVSLSRGASTALQFNVWIQCGNLAFGSTTDQNLALINNPVSGYSYYRASMQHYCAEDTRVVADTPSAGSAQYNVTYSVTYVPYAIGSSTATTTDQRFLGSISFGLVIIITLLFLGFVGYIYNSFTTKKPWL